MSLTDILSDVWQKGKCGHSAPWNPGYGGFVCTVERVTCRDERENERSRMGYTVLKGKYEIMTVMCVWPQSVCLSACVWEKEREQYWLQSLFDRHRLPVSRQLTTWHVAIRTQRLCNVRPSSYTLQRRGNCYQVRLFYWVNSGHWWTNPDIHSWKWWLQAVFLIKSSGYRQQNSEIKTASAYKTFLHWHHVRFIH